ncbi:thermonuclease family protein, partial [bacterium]|nr:thermonuclease family protein [bacterium]
MRTSRRVIFALIALLLVVGLLAIQKSLQGDVARVIDGDTFVLKSGQHVRLIGINAPELHHPVLGEEPYGKEAKEHLEKLIKGKKVRLEFDVQKYDKYGRLLAYVYVDKIFVNAKMVEDGYAQVMTVPPNVKYQELFLKLQREAMEKERGLWERRYIVDKSKGIYHLPDCPLLKKIANKDKAEMSASEIAKKGYKPCDTCKPLLSTPPLEKGNWQYVGNKSSMKFHRLDCPWAKKISERNRIYFKTREEAIK